MNSYDSQRPPGLISWKRSVCALGVLIEEEWDLTVKDCPILVFKIHPDFERDDSAMFFRRSYILREYKR